MFPFKLECFPSGIALPTSHRMKIPSRFPKTHGKKGWLQLISLFLLCVTVEIHEAKSISKLCPKLNLLLFIWSNTFASPELPCSTHPVKGRINL